MAPLPRGTPDRRDQLRPVGAPLRIATAHIDGRQRLGDLREGHRPDLTLYKSLQEGHVLVAGDGLPQGVECRVDNLPAAISGAHRPGSSPSAKPPRTQ